MEKKLKHYLEILKKIGIEPNFFMSLPYLLLSNVKILDYRGYIWLEADGWCVFPPVYVADIRHKGLCPSPKIWIDYENYATRECSDLIQYNREFLDYEYIYDPKEFKKLEGSKWATYRKNIKKWPRRNEKWFSAHPIPLSHRAKLLEEWLTAKGDDTQDSDFIVKYIMDEDAYQIGIYNNGVYHENELVAIIAWDENWKYINFRFLITKPNEPFLDEFARSRFYLDEYVQTRGKLVNDGGVLGSKGLERFKDKLNPLIKRKRYSLIK